MSTARDTNAPIPSDTDRATPRAGVFGRLASWSQRHRWGALLL